jgi:antitoxin Phd
MEAVMTTWPVQEAKARFSELLRASIAKGPQIVSHHGKDAVVVVPVEQWRRLQRQAQPGLKTLLLAPAARGELPVAERGRLRRRPPTAAR